MEVVVVVIEYRHELHAFNRGIIRPPDKPSMRLFGCGLLGASLVAIGVSGELFIHVKAGRIESEMREANRTLVALVNARAGQADERAAKAQERAAELEKEAAVLQERMFEMGPRDVLLDRQRAKELVDAIKPFPRQGFVMLDCAAGPAYGKSLDPEIRKTVDQIADVLKMAGWNRFPFGSFSPCGRENGIWIGTFDNATPRTRKRARILLAAFTRVPLVADWHELGPSGTPDLIGIGVATNPARPAHANPPFIPRTTISP